jgi:Amidohydrolase family
MGVLIKNGNIITGDSRYVADILCENETITRIDRKIAPPAGAEVIDASGKYIFPGFIDPHTHIYLPFMGTYSKDDYETGTKAALVGGTTTNRLQCVRRLGNRRQAVRRYCSRRSRRACGKIRWNDRTRTVRESSDCVISNKPSRKDGERRRLACSVRRPAGHMHNLHSEVFGETPKSARGDACAPHPFYPLMEPSVMPFTKRRIEKMKRTITGMLAIA